ncbi:MAG: hypothetical protein ACPG5B_05185 [Chitinophagales bacterium]
MKALKIGIILLISFSLLSFSTHRKMNKKIVGVWIFSDFQNAIYEYSKEKALVQNKGGFQFKKNGKMIIRQNIGWCGTPPISYGNNEGTWQKIGSSKISMQYKYWGGEIIEKWEIKCIGQQNMSVKVLDSKSIRREYEKKD